MNTITSDAERLAFEDAFKKRWPLVGNWGKTFERARGGAGHYLLSDVDTGFEMFKAARNPGAGLRLVPEVPNESVLLFLMGGLVEPQEADEMQDEITQEEADAINDRCRTDARLHYAEILNIATKDAA